GGGGELEGLTMREAAPGRRGERANGRAGGEAQLGPPQIADELEDSLVQLSSGGERRLPLLPQTPPPGRALLICDVPGQSVGRYRGGERRLPLLPQIPPPGRGACGLHRENAT